MFTRKLKGTRGFKCLELMALLKEAFTSLIALLVKYPKGCVHAGKAVYLIFDINLYFLRLTLISKTPVRFIIWKMSHAVPGGGGEVGGGGSYTIYDLTKSSIPYLPLNCGSHSCPKHNL